LWYRRSPAVDADDLSIPDDQRLISSYPSVHDINNVDVRDHQRPLR
jgi:hypothetical protein